MVYGMALVGLSPLPRRDHSRSLSSPLSLICRTPTPALSAFNGGPCLTSPGRIIRRCLEAFSVPPRVIAPSAIQLYQQTLKGGTELSARVGCSLGKWHLSIEHRQEALNGRPAKITHNISSLGRDTIETTKGVFIAPFLC